MKTKVPCFHCGKKLFQSEKIMKMMKMMKIANYKFSCSDCNRKMNNEAKKLQRNKNQNINSYSKINWELKNDDYVKSRRKDLIVVPCGHCGKKIKQLKTVVQMFFTKGEKFRCKVCYTSQSLLTKARYLDIRENNVKKINKYWTENEIKILKEYYPHYGMGIPKLLKTNNRTMITEKAQELNLRYDNSWTEKEIKLLKIQL